MKIKNIKKQIHATAKVILKAQRKIIKNPLNEEKLLTTKAEFNIRELLSLPYIIPHEADTPRNVVEITDYPDLKKRGLLITSLKVRVTWFDGQKVRYTLIDKREPKGIIYWEGPPRGIKIQYDRNNDMFRLVGKNVSPSYVGPWVRGL